MTRKKPSDYDSRLYSFENSYFNIAVQNNYRFSKSELKTKELGGQKPFFKTRSILLSKLFEVQALLNALWLHRRLKVWMIYPFP